MDDSSQMEIYYKFFKVGDFKVRGCNGEFRCPFNCSCNEEDDLRYTHLLRHAIRVAEGSISRKQRAKHSAMASFLAFDLANEVEAEADQQLSNKRSRVEREKEALDRVHELERRLNETRDEINALTAKERASNEALQSVRKELIKGYCEIHGGRSDEIGIKKIGELDPRVFISELHEKELDHDQVFISELPGRIFPRRDIVIRGVELCTLWQEKIKDPHWYPFQIVEDDTGKPQRVLRKDDTTLQALMEEWGQVIHDAVVEAVTGVEEHGPSGCYMVPELWNFSQWRKVGLDEVIRHVFHQLRAVKGNEPRAQPRKSPNMKGSVD
ncbi:hypothetical protein C2S52_005339 [Perilla frutescens var. hirtella]|nr:hypothetical protein C2S52_005339 [Perilla frutescens var. hirtella]